jgi:hypothetical protein
MKHWVHDYETLMNCFVAVFSEYKLEEERVFVISNLRNDFEEFYAFLQGNKLNNETHISFNGLHFDSQLTEYVLRSYE